MAQTTPSSSQVEPHDSLYTILVIVAAVMLLIGIIVIAARSVSFFGSLWPAGGA